MAILQSFYPSAPSLEVPEDMATVFRQAFLAMDEASIPYSLDGGLPTYLYTGICRDVHDLDLRVLPQDVQRAMQALEAIGFEAGVNISHGWLRPFETRSRSTWSLGWEPGMPPSISSGLTGAVL